jgi:galactose oxidase-like protein/Kelch motif protein
MTTPRDPDALLAAYLADGMEILSDRVVDAVLDEVHRTRQRAVFGPWRTRSMSRSALGAAAVVAVLVLGGAFYLAQRAPSSVGTPSPMPSGSSSPSQPASPSAVPSPSAASTATTAPGQMTGGRSTHTASILADGRVLVAGGFFNAVPVVSADLYDPQTGTFTATGAMATARGFDTATLLNDGRVLFAGGSRSNWADQGPFFASAELYDPTTGTFSPTGSMATGRNLHTATLLLDGRVLITGGNDAYGHSLASAELYDPKTGTFSPTGSMATARGFHTATRLADGRVLIAGGDSAGWSAGHGLASAEIYDPKTGTFSPTGPMTESRGSHVATLLPDGRVLITGGVDSNGRASLASAELYDPKTGKFTPTGSMADGRTFHAAALLEDGRVLVTGGVHTGLDYAAPFLASAEIYDPKAGTFTPTGSMTDGRIAQTATLLPDGHVLVAGGFDGKADVTTAELYDPESGTFKSTGSAG